MGGFSVVFFFQFCAFGSPTNTQKMYNTKIKCHLPVTNKSQTPLHGHTTENHTPEVSTDTVKIEIKPVGEIQ